jgi:phosphoribosyl-AMP cyclohydrolase
MTNPQPWSPRGDTKMVEQGTEFAPLFDPNGLLPAIVTDAATHQTLMFAWMNAEALRLTIETGYAHFWSRSRNKIWLKGEESGNKLAVRAARTDCDQDVLLVEVQVEGDAVACHTGARTCFYRHLDLAGAKTAPKGDPVRLSR